MIKKKYKVVNQTNGKIISYLDPDDSSYDFRDSLCYIHLREQDGDNEYWAVMTGELALELYRPGEIVEAELSFCVCKSNRSHRYYQDVVVNEICHVKDKKVKSVG